MRWFEHVIDLQIKEWNKIIDSDDTLIININEFDTRIKNVLIRNDIISINQIKDKPRFYFERMTNLGKESINIIMNYLTNRFYKNLYDFE